MKRFLILLSLLFCSTSFAATETINWYVDGTSYATTTCQTGGDIILPNTPYKYGYTFQGWNGYTPIEYLETVGSPYIDTEVIPNSSMEIYYKIQIDYDINSNDPLIGSRSAWYDGFVFIIGRNQIIVDWFETSESQRWLFSCITSSKDIYEISIKNSIATIKQNNIVIGTHSFTPKGSTPYSILLNAVNSINGTIEPSSSTKKIYHFKLYNNNVLVRDFIPVLDPYGTPCMYDKVTQQFFYNQGTGNFIAGPVINQ
jgi:hypothetical protein